MDDTMGYSSRMIRKIFDSLSAHIAIIDDQGQVLETNAAWKAFSKANGGSGRTKGLNYLSICESARDEGAEDAKAVARGIRRVIAKEIPIFLYDYPCHSPKGLQWFYMRAVLMEASDDIRVIVSHEDITQLKLAQKALKDHQAELEEKNLSLEEANIALKVLLSQRETDKREMEKKFLTHIKTFVLPYLSKLKAGNQNQRDLTLINIVENQLNEVITPLMSQLANAQVMLTPQEMQVAALVKEGKTTQQISDILYISEATVSFHRKNIRAKLGLKNRQANLRSFLLSMS